MGILEVTSPHFWEVKDIVILLLKEINFFFDNLVYSAIGWFYKLLLYLANINLLAENSNGTNYFNDLISRVYVFLGIFMLFRISLSMIQYIADPNSFSDESKGFGKLVKNVLISLVLLISVPWLFNRAYYVQSIILENNIIGQLVMGTTITNSGNKKDNATALTKNAESNAKDVQFLMYSAFVTLNKETKEFSNCPIVIGSNDLASKKECLDSFGNFLNEYNDEENSNISLKYFFKYSDGGEIKDDRQFSAFFSLLKLESEDNNGNSVPIIDYKYVISFLAGGYVAVILLMYCIDVAVRILKLAFLQMIAPIAIVSYIDPKESMSNSKLKNWLSECGSTYASLFIRLATIFLTMMLVSNVANMVVGGLTEDMTGGYTIEGKDKVAVYVLLTIGIFMFAKKVPEMIENIFGIKASGELRLGSIGKAMGFGLAGGAIGSIGGAVGSIAASKNQGLGFKKGLGNAARGFLSGGARGNLGAMRAKDIKGAWKGGISGIGTAARSVGLRNATNAKDRVGARLRNAVGMQSKFEGLEGRRKMYEGIATKADDMKKRAMDQMSAKDQNYTALQVDKQRVEQMYRNGRMSRDNYRKQMKAVNEKEDKMIANYINQNGAYLNGGSADTEITNAKEAIRTTIDENGLVKENSAYANVSDWDGIKAAKTAASKKETEIRNSDKYSDAKAIDEAQKSGMMQSHMKD